MILMRPPNSKGRPSPKRIGETVARRRGFRMSAPAAKIQAAYVSLPKAAAFLGISTRHMRRLVERGVPIYRFSEKGHARVRLPELDQWVRENCRADHDLDELVSEIVRNFE